jgi:hypothetical protein
MKSVILALTVCAGAAQAQMVVELQDPWDGMTLPAGQHCPLQGGTGATPPMLISAIPDGTVQLRVAFNDLSYAPLSIDGGHGVLAFETTGPVANLPAVPGLTDVMPDGVSIVSPARSSGDYASPGYLPPCSGGNGNLYAADVSAIGADGAVLETVTVEIGRY